MTTTWAPDGSAEAVADTIAATVRAGGRTFAVPGGSTPGPIFALLAGEDLPWGQLHFHLTDDRLVPPDHEASNFGQMARVIGPTGALLHQMEEGETVPAFDLVWFGMGEDGHIASLFPGADAPVDDPPAVIRRPVPPPPNPPYERLTLNYAALGQAASVILVARGANKRILLDGAIEGENDLPIARFLNSARAPVTIFWSA